MRQRDQNYELGVGLYYKMLKYSSNYFFIYRHCGVVAFPTVGTTSKPQNQFTEYHQ